MDKYYGHALAAFFAAAIFIVGMYIQAMEPGIIEGIDEEDQFPALIQSTNPRVMEEQLRVRQISRVARRLQDDYLTLTQLMEQIPPFSPPQNRHLAERHVELYNNVYYAYVREINSFMKNNVGKHAGALRVLAWVGMFQDYTQIVRMRALVENNCTEAEFEWIKNEIMWAALFAVQHKLDHDPMSEEQKRHLMEMRHQLYLLTSVIEKDEGGYEHEHWERLDLSKVPQQNIALFLEHYEDINYTNVHFDRPTRVVFDKAAIMAAAGSNPP